MSEQGVQREHIGGVVGIALGLSRDHSLTVRRMETVEALYAAEAGLNMSIREMMNDQDEDLDGGTGTVSDDGDPGTDPTLGNAQFNVVSSYDPGPPGETTLTAEGRSGDARRKMQSVIEDP